MNARGLIIIAAIIFDLVVLVAFLVIKWSSDSLIVYLSIGGIALVFAFEKFYLGRRRGNGGDDHKFDHAHT